MTYRVKPHFLTMLFTAQRSKLDVAFNWPYFCVYTDLHWLSSCFLVFVVVVCFFEKADMSTLVTTVLLTALKMSYCLRLIVKLSIKERPCIICYIFFSSKVCVG